jgi:hypothetical protein
MRHLVRPPPLLLLHSASTPFFQRCAKFTFSLRLRTAGRLEQTGRELSAGRFARAVKRLEQARRAGDGRHPPFEPRRTLPRASSARERSSRERSEWRAREGRRAPLGKSEQRKRGFRAEPAMQQTSKPRDAQAVGSNKVRAPHRSTLPSKKSVRASREIGSRSGLRSGACVITHRRVGASSCWRHVSTFHQRENTARCGANHARTEPSRTRRRSLTNKARTI